MVKENALVVGAMIVYYELITVNKIVSMRLYVHAQVKRFSWLGFFI